MIMNIILGEKNTEIRTFLKDILLRIKPKSFIKECSTWDCALFDLIKKDNVEFIFIDINILGFRWIERLQELLTLCQKTRIVLISDKISIAQAEDFFNQGLVAFISLRDFQSSMDNILHFILNGGLYLSPQILNQSTLISPYLPDGNQLTGRQKEVLSYLAMGYSNKKIMSKMNISEPTVKLHIHNLFVKLNATNRTQIVLNAQKLGII